MPRALTLVALLLASPALAQEDTPAADEASEARGPKANAQSKAEAREQAQRQRRCRKGKARMEELDAELAQMDADLAVLSAEMSSAKRRDKDEAMEALLLELVDQRGRTQEINMERTRILLEAQEMGCFEGRRGPGKGKPPGPPPEGPPPEAPSAE